MIGPSHVEFLRVPLRPCKNSTAIAFCLHFSLATGWLYSIGSARLLLTLKRLAWQPLVVSDMFMIINRCHEIRPWFQAVLGKSRYRFSAILPPITREQSNLPLKPLTVAYRLIGFPPHWVAHAIPYGQLKKCLKKVQRELQELGLDAETLRALLDSDTDSPVALNYSLNGMPVLFDIYNLFCSREHGLG